MAPTAIAAIFTAIALSIAASCPAVAETHDTPTVSDTQGFPGVIPAAPGNPNTGYRLQRVVRVLGDHLDEEISRLEMHAHQLHYDDEPNPFPPAYADFITTLGRYVETAELFRRLDEAARFEGPLATVIGDSIDAKSTLGQHTIVVQVHQDEVEIPSVFLRTPDDTFEIVADDCTDRLLMRRHSCPITVGWQLRAARTVGDTVGHLVIAVRNPVTAVPAGGHRTIALTLTPYGRTDRERPNDLVDDA